MVRGLELARRHVGARSRRGDATWRPRINRLETSDAGQLQRCVRAPREAAAQCHPHVSAGPRARASPLDPSAISLDPFGPLGPGRRQRQVKNRNDCRWRPRMQMATMSFSPRRSSLTTFTTEPRRGIERQCKVFRDHRVPARRQFRVAVRFDRGLFDHFRQPRLSESVCRGVALLRRFARRPARVLVNLSLGVP